MICVSIGRGRHRHLIAEHKHLVEQGIKLVELRLDYINGDINIRRVLPGRPGPVILTIRRPKDGGRFEGGEDKRLLILRSAIADGVDYVDLEDDIAAKIPRYGSTKRVISYHNFNTTPDNLEEIHKRLADLDADVVKIATLANHPHDNLRMLNLIKSAKIPTVGICMGEMGTPTRLLAGTVGAPFTYATFHQDRTMAPGQLSFQQMKDVYDYESIDSSTQFFGVIGDPIVHSLSPHLHNAAFRHLKMNKRLIAFRIPRDALAKFMEDCKELGLSGLAVTIPHKEAILHFATQFESNIKDIGAANTLVYRDSNVKAANTDYRGAMDALASAMDIGDHQRPALKGKTAIVLGAGGAAKAVAYGLVRRGADVVITSRTRERAAKLAESFGCTTSDWSARYNVWAEIVVNCTPVGMHPNVDETPYDRHHLRPNMLIFDTVYNPENTLLIKQARDRGCTVVTGVEMFVRQAAAQFKLFTGEEAPLDVMRESLKKATGAAR